MVGATGIGVAVGTGVEVGRGKRVAVGGGTGVGKGVDVGVGVGGCSASDPQAAVSKDIVMSAAIRAIRMDIS